MPRIPTAEVSEELLDSLFDEFDIWVKIGSSQLTSEPVAEKDAPSWQWPNATSRILKHHLPGGKHVITTHCVLGSQGEVLHWDVKDFRLHEVRLYRL